LSTDDKDQTQDHEPAEDAAAAPEEPAAESADEAATAPRDETAAGDETTRAALSSETAADSSEEPGGEPVASEPSAPAPDDSEATPPAPAPADAEATPAGSEAAAPAPPADEREEEFEPAPRAKPEIPGADLEPVFVPQEEQYLDAEAQAAAEAEAEAAAEKARAEAEDEQATPIADAAIDLAAGARYTATGKRKTAVARVILRPGKGEYLINGKTLVQFFPRETLQRVIRQPLEAVGYDARMDVVARMHGGGVSAQAGALRHGISRALIDADPNLRGELKRRGYLTRDPRVKERKKAGLKKARKRPQFSKR
jgi:small subunit ribosomal protein S9